MFTKIISFCLFFQLKGVFCQEDSVFKVAFGSCSHQENDLTIFNTVIEHDPDVFVFLGDNIYGDTKDPTVLKEKYKQLGDQSSFKNLKQNTTVIATWDDHDYGENDAGKNYKQKGQSKEVFLEFFEEPIDSERRSHAGIYASYEYKMGEKIIQIILLDCRTFRDNQRHHRSKFYKGKRRFYRMKYKPHSLTSQATILGEEQWAWLSQELLKPADVRIIGSGIQFANEFNGYEGWTNFPNEQQKFMELIKSTKANGVFFISGDVHYAEISKMESPEMYPIYDVTSSGLSSKWHFATPNKNRIEGPIMENHFGLISIDCSKPIPDIKIEIWDIENNQRIENQISLKTIQFSDI